jgi:hypothetical protein
VLQRLRPRDSQSQPADSQSQPPPPLFTSGVVGSLPRPEYVRELVRNHPPVIHARGRGGDTGMGIAISTD